MAKLLMWIGIAGVLGCGSKAGETGSGSAGGSAERSSGGSAAGSGAGSSSGSAAGSSSGGSATGSGSGSANTGSGSNSGSTVTACLPNGRGQAFGRVGSDLVTCEAGEDGSQTCWTIDRATGKVTPRKGAPIPGVGFSVLGEKLPKPNCFGELCWPEDPDGATTRIIYVAYHPDGKRVAINTSQHAYVFDLATKKVIASFDAALGNGLSGLWMVGELVLVAGSDAGPYAELHVLSTTGAKLSSFNGFYEGGLGITSDGKALVHQTALEDLTILDAKTGRGKTRKRSLPHTACNPHDPGLDGESDDPKVKACIAYRVEHFDPYSGATIVDDGPNFLGATEDELFVLDGKSLKELSRVKLAVCPKPPGTTD